MRAARSGSRCKVGAARDGDRARARARPPRSRVHRFRFFGREAISFLLVLPIALPGIITGMALNSFFTFGGVDFSLWTIVIGHATFCIVVVYNNVIARLRRTPPLARSRRRWTSAPTAGRRSATSRCR